MNSISLSFEYNSRTFSMVLHVMSMLLFLISATQIKFSVLKLNSDNICNISTLLKFVFVLKFRHVGLGKLTAVLPRTLWAKDGL